MATKRARKPRATSAKFLGTADLHIQEWPGGFQWVLKIETSEVARSKLHYETREQAEAAFFEFVEQARHAEVR